MFLPPPYKNGFTLAEVLITLVIIGVIAAITVPTLIVKYQKEQTVTRLKKAYSAIAQANPRAVADHGSTLNWEVENNKSQEFAEKYLTPYLVIAKNCKYSTEEDCSYPTTYLNGNNRVFGNNFYRFYLNDGTMVYVAAVSYDNDTTDPDTGETVNKASGYADIYIDINGPRKPNRIGRDIFMFRYLVYTNIASYNQKALGRLMSPDSDVQTREEALSNEPWGCNTNAQGLYCAQVIMADGWRIADDYPW